MRRWLVILLLLLAVGSAQAGTTATGILRDDLSVYKARLVPASPLTDATLNAAVTAIGATAKTLLVTPGTWTLANDVTIPAHIHLHLVPGAVFSINTTKTLTIDGSFTAPAQQVFSGAGAVLFGPGLVTPIQPVWWGATADGTTDDTVAAQAALNAVPTVGGTVEFIRGTYLIGSSLLPKSHTTVRIAAGATLKANVVAWADTGLLALTSVTDIVVEGSGILDGNKAANATGRIIGIKVLDSSGVTIRGLTIQNFPGSTAAGGTSGDAIYLGGSAAGAVNILVEGTTLSGNVRQGTSIVQGSFIRIRGNHIASVTGTSPGAGIDLEPNTGGTVTNVSIEGNTIDDAATGVIVTAGTTTIARVTIAHNLITSPRVNGITHRGCTGLVIKGNIIGNSLGNGITVVAPGTSGPTTSLVIEGNLIHTPASTGIALSTHVGALVTGNRIIAAGVNGIQGDGTVGSLYAENVISGSTGEGMLFQQAGFQYNTIRGNISRGNTLRGIRLLAGTHNLVAENVVEGNASTGIQEASAADNNMLLNNKALNNTPNLTFVGASSMVRQNAGFVTEATGTGSIASGATTAVITHGLGYTPTVGEISITLGENPTNDVGAVFVTTIGATQFTVNVENAPGTSNLDFGWNVRKQ